MHQTDGRRSFDVGELTRVEGEGALHVVVEGDTIVDLAFSIFEAPRFFEALMRGRSHLEAPDITARICGICPVAYQTSAANAIEQILDMDVGERIRDLRRLLYMAEWIESHALHIYLLHAPDFLGYPSGVAMARDFPTEVERALRLKKVGNSMMTLIGGREIHPINPRIGGFWKAPARHDLDEMVDSMEWALEAAKATVHLVAGFPFPSLEPHYEFVALSDPDEYAVIGGRIRSTEGIDIPVEQWNEVFEEEHVERSNALHARVRARGSYLTGPLARYNLNFEQLHPEARRAAIAAGMSPTERNPFKSIVVRAIETVHAVATSLDILDRYAPPELAHVDAPPRSGEGHGASEAPRGMLYHRYVLDERGMIEEAQIVPPTSQNQLRIEEDMRELLVTVLGRSDDEIRHLLEQTIRNYDPCISCATHFLDLHIERR